MHSGTVARDPQRVLEVLLLEVLLPKLPGTVLHRAHTVAAPRHRRSAIPLTVLSSAQTETVTETETVSVQTERVFHCANALAVGYPEGGSPRKGLFHANTAANGVGFDQHIDGMYTMEQWEATPSRALVSFD